MSGGRGGGLMILSHYFCSFISTLSRIFDEKVGPFSESLFLIENSLFSILRAGMG